MGGGGVRGGGLQKGMHPTLGLVRERSVQGDTVLRVFPGACVNK